MEELREKALKIRDQYHEINKLKGENKWTFKEYMEGFVVDVGDLMKMIMAKANLRSYPVDVDESIAHELSDCLWCVLVIAAELNVDIEKTFLNDRTDLINKLESHIEKLKAENKA